jgi:NADPH-dependent 2,4-dienoyl-CoA reductase/sulfur reductase-like enzyme
MEVPAGWLLPSAAAIKRAVKVPVIGVSRIIDPAVANAAIAGGEVDLVAFGRALLTDPELANKARDGRQEEILSCIGCNQGCIDRISHQLDVTCLVNPRVGREPGFEVIKSPIVKRVVVVGGGPSGMEVARTCAERGHDVRLYDRNDRLGGTLALASLLPERPGWGVYIEQSQRRLLAAGVDVRLGITIEGQELAGFRADTVVLATGARFVVPNEAASSPVVPALTAPQLLVSGPGSSGRVLVCGAGHVGLGVAAWLANRDTDVTVVSEDREIINPPGQDGLVDRLLSTGKVSFVPGRRLARFDGKNAVLCLRGAIGALFEEHIEDVSAVVWTTLRQPCTELADVARRLGGGLEVWEVGDCIAPRDALEAVYEGAVVGRRV